MASGLVGGLIVVAGAGATPVPAWADPGGDAGAAVSVTADHFAAIHDDTVTFTASVAAPNAGDPTPAGGMVSFADHGSTIAGCGSVAIDGDGKATCAMTLGPGATEDLSVVASYRGDASYGQSSSGPTAVPVFLNRTQFNSIGSSETWTVPPEVTEVRVVARGAQGGPGTSCLGGRGAIVAAAMTVAPGTTIQVNAGGAGVGGHHGYNGGGGTDLIGGRTGDWVRGGGASDVRFAPFDLASRVVVAGGGGACGFVQELLPLGNGAGGGGGRDGLAGGDGFPFGDRATGGGGGTGSAGGAGGTGGFANPQGGYTLGAVAESGALATGGTGLQYQVNAVGGGGGGGYYGGGGGGVLTMVGNGVGLMGEAAGGGGGSSLVPPGGDVRDETVVGEGSVEIYYSGRISTTTSVDLPSVVPVGTTLHAAIHVVGAPGHNPFYQPSGDVDLQRDGQPVPGCQDLPVDAAVCDLSFATIGLHHLTAQYSGDANFLPSANQVDSAAVVAPTITSSDAITFHVGDPGSFTVTTEPGLPTPVLIEAFDLPPGLGLTNNGDGTATLFGTPPVSTGSTYPIRFTARAVGSDLVTSQSATLTVTEGPTITSDVATAATEEKSMVFGVTTHGYPTRSAITIDGQLPDGLTFTDRGDGSALFTGTPAVGSRGTYVFTITAHSNGYGPDAVQIFTLTVLRPPVITSVPAMRWVSGQYASYTITTDSFGYDPVSFSKSALLNRNLLTGGLQFTDNGDGTATISGSPQSFWDASPSQHSGVTPQLAFFIGNSQGSALGKVQFELDTPPGFLFTPSDIAWHQDQPVAFTISTFGFPSPAVRVEGTLPDGLTFTDNHDGTATITGAPTALAVGASTVTLVADNGIGDVARHDLHINVLATTTVRGRTSITRRVGVPLLLKYKLAGPAQPASFDFQGLPQGFGFIDHHDGYAELVGTPVPGTGGIHVVAVLVTTGTTYAKTTLTITVREAVTITSPSVANMTPNPNNIPNGFIVRTTGGFPTGPVKITKSNMIAGTLGPSDRLGLPPGLTFQDNGDGTATIRGFTQPVTQRTVYRITIRARTVSGVVRTQELRMTVLPTG